MYCNSQDTWIWTVIPCKCNVKSYFQEKLHLKGRNQFRKLMNVEDLGPVVQSIVSLTSSLVVKMLTVLVSTICNSWVFLLKKM